MRRVLNFGQIIFVLILAVRIGGSEGAIPTRPLKSEYLIQGYTTADGLPDNRIFAIDQDPEGYLWLGTQGGMACWDGMRFTRWKPGNLTELKDQQILKISVSPERVVWLVSRRELIKLDEGRVARYAGETFSIPNFTIGPLLAKREGLWMGSSYGLIRMERQGIRVYSFDSGLPHKAISALEVDSAGDVWVGTASGLAKHVADEDRFTKELGPRTFLGQSVIALLEDRNKVMWIIPAEEPHGTNPRKIAYFKNGRWNFLEAPDVVNGGRRNNIFLEEDSQGHIWAPAGPRGLYRGGVGGLELMEFPEEFQGDFPLSFKEDREGNVWVGLENGGLMKLQPKRVKVIQGEKGIPLQAESVLATGNGTVWIGTTDGLFRMKEAGPIAVRADRPLRNVRALMEDRGGNIWMGSRDALLRIENESARTVFAFTNMTDPPKIKGLLEARDGAIWAGTIRGIYRFKEGNYKVWTVEGSLAAKEVRALGEDGAGRIWAAMLGKGINVYENGTWTHLTEADGLASDYVWDFHRDGEGNLWIATRLGLSVWDGRKIRTVEGELNHEILEIVAENSNGLWFTSPRGVCRVEREQLLKKIMDGVPLPKVWYYGRQEGLPDLSFAGDWSQGGGAYLPGSGLLLACDSGLVRLQPEESRGIPGPVAVIEQITANQEVIYRRNPPTDGAEPEGLPMRDLDAEWNFAPGAAQVIEVEFSSPSFRSPGSTRFTYRLLGVSEAWRKVGPTRHATFANLTPGRYTFELLAENKYGMRSAGPARFSFCITPRFTQTKAFYGMSAGSLGIFLAAVHFWRLKKVGRIAELERQVQLAAQRENFARTIHDELGADLSAIARLASIPDTPASVDARARLTRVGEISRELSHAVRDSIWAATPEHDTLEETLSKIRDDANRFLMDMGVERSIHIPGDPPDRRVSGEFRRGIVLVVKEALHNAVKHAHATKISLEISLEESLKIEVRDNGRGFEAAEEALPARGRGLKDVRQVTEELGGRVVIRSENSAGTQVVISLPLP